MDLEDLRPEVLEISEVVQEALPEVVTKVDLVVLEAMATRTVDLLNRTLSLLPECLQKLLKNSFQRILALSVLLRWTSILSDIKFGSTAIRPPAKERARLL